MLKKPVLNNAAIIALLSVSVKVCPICKSSDLSPDWRGSILVVDPATSLVAKALGITEKGKYALKVT